MWQLAYVSSPGWLKHLSSTIVDIKHFLQRSCAAISNELIRSMMACMAVYGLVLQHVIQCTWHVGREYLTSHLETKHKKDLHMTLEAHMDCKGFERPGVDSGSHAAGDGR